MSERKLFGTDGIRGRANIFPMTGEVAFSLGRAVTAYFQRSSKNHQPISSSLEKILDLVVIC